MLMHMIGKLSKDQKVDWSKHLPELVHAYNSMRLDITGYSLHYLMFRDRVCCPVNFYFSMVNHYVAELCERLQEAFKEAQTLSTSEEDRQKWHYDRKANAISLELGDLVLAKADAYGGGER